MEILISILVSAISVFAAGYVLPGIHLDSFMTAIVVAIVLGLINAFIRPLLLILTLPINVLTLGLFTFVIMGGLVLLTSAIVPGFRVDGFWWAVAFSLVLWVINNFLQSFDHMHKV